MNFDTIKARLKRELCVENFNERLREAARSGCVPNLKDLLMDPDCDA